MKDSFILYTSHYQTFQLLTIEEKGQLFDMIFQFHLTGKEPETESFPVKMAFSFLKQQFERDLEKYNKIVERNKANIGKRWNKNYTKNTNGKSGIPSDTKNTDNDNDNDNDLNINNKLFISEKKSEKKINVKEIVSTYNKTLGGTLPVVQKITKDRSTLVRGIYNEYGQDTILNVFDKVKESDFLTGKAEKSWGNCCFDWIMNKKNFLKILEGNYDNNKKQDSNKKQIYVIKD